MLILNRNIQESIIIDGRIYVTIIGAGGKQVRMGVYAPESIVVDRA